MTPPSASDRTSIIIGAASIAMIVSAIWMIIHIIAGHPYD